MELFSIKFFTSKIFLKIDYLYFGLEEFLDDDLQELFWNWKYLILFPQNKTKLWKIEQKNL